MKSPDQSLLENVINHEATPCDARHIAQWLSTPEGQLWLSEQMDIDSESIRLGEEAQYINHQIPTDNMYEYLKQKIRRQKIRRWIGWAAAIFIPLILITILFVEVDSRVDLFAATEYDEVYVPKGERMQVLFQDGSRVYLNSESRIRYPRQFGIKERKVELEGEGWFEVAKNHARPFIVDITLLNVRVLGTTFDVKAYPEDNEIAVSLESGIVEVFGNTFNAFTMDPGQKAVYNRATGRCNVERPQEITLQSAWRQNTLVFTDAPLSEVIATLGRTYDITFKIEDPAVTRYNYTLRTSFTDISRVLDELEKITPVRFSQTGHVVNVSLNK